jgi:diaminohydroxyphosphoribosylaminopyrimidine deaminase/5-amino-6-(5-phosphoribosylamino)uracil reductase
MRTEDLVFMRRAISLAKKGKGRTSPNPCVGAVVVRDGKIVGEGYHRKAGEAHAEVLALKRAGDLGRGSTLYVNLEPCAHHGKTPPCVDAIINAGVKRVVVAMIDPNPMVNGRGLEILKGAGIDVEVGILSEKARELNEDYEVFITKGRPFVILKMAATLDGKTSTPSGESKWISGEGSRALVHRIRGEVDALIVGVDTVIKDDPLLISRSRRKAKDPARIVLDSTCRIPKDSRILKDARRIRTIVATTRKAPPERIESLLSTGAEVLVVEEDEMGRVSVERLLSLLGSMGMMSVMVEGGRKVARSFLDSGLIDKILLFIAPKIMGGDDSPSIFGGRGPSSLSQARDVEIRKVRRIGEDVMIEARCSRG